MEWVRMHLPESILSQTKTITISQLRCEMRQFPLRVHIFQTEMRLVEFLMFLEMLIQGWNCPVSHFWTWLIVILTFLIVSLMKIKDNKHSNHDMNMCSLKLGNQQVEQHKFHIRKNRFFFVFICRYKTLIRYRLGSASGVFIQIEAMKYYHIICKIDWLVFYANFSNISAISLL